MKKLSPPSRLFGTKYIRKFYRNASFANLLTSVYAIHQVGLFSVPISFLKGELIMKTSAIQRAVGQWHVAPDTVIVFKGEEKSNPFGNPYTPFFESVKLASAGALLGTVAIETTAALSFAFWTRWWLSFISATPR